MNCSTPGFPVLNYLPICSNSYPLNRWCYLNISTSSTPFSSCPQSFLVSESFSIELALHIRWPKYWSFSNSISPSNEYSGLVSFRIDLFDLLAVPGTLSTTVQKHPFLGTHLFLWPNSHNCTWQLEKTIALIIWTFVSKLMSLTMVIWKQREMTTLLLLVPTEARVQRKVGV